MRYTGKTNKLRVRLNRTRTTQTTTPTKTQSDPQSVSEYDTFIQVRITHREQLADISMLLAGGKHHIDGVGVIEVEYLCQMLNGEMVIVPDIGLDDTAQ